MTTYEIINSLCKTRKTTISQLCFQLTDSKGNLQTWKKNNISQSHLLKIADYFNVSIDYLLGRTGISTPVDELISNSQKYIIDFSEFELIKKYRAIPTKGKEAVKYILNREYENIIPDHEPLVPFQLAARAENNNDTEVNELLSKSPKK